MKEYRRYAQLVALIVLSLLLVSPRSDVSVTATPEDPLTTAIAATGAVMQELSVNGWAKLPLYELTDGEMEAMARRAMGRLGLNPDQYQIFHQKSSQHRQVKAEAFENRSHTVVIVQVLYPAWEKKGHEVYMVINVDKATSAEYIPALQAKISGAISDNGGLARVNTCLVGWLDGKLEEDERAAKLRAAFKAVNASVLSSFSYSHGVSFTGFTPLVSESLLVGKDQVNLNIAIRYSQFDNRTYVMVGSPIITREY